MTRSLLKIVKSAYVQVGEKREIKLGKTKDISKRERSNIEKPSYKTIEYMYNKKMEEIKVQMNEKINKANQEAQKIIQDANKEAEKIYEQSRINGLNQGKAEGYQMGKCEADQLIKEALMIKEEILNNKKSMVKELEREIIEFIIQIVEKVLNHKMEDSKETIIGLVQSALKKCTFTESVVLRISPADYDDVLSIKDKIVCLSENIDDITIKKDTSLKKGSCIVDTAAGSIDCSIDTQLDQIKLLFNELLKSE